MLQGLVINYEVEKLEITNSIWPRKWRFQWSIDYKLEFWLLVATILKQMQIKIVKNNNNHIIMVSIHLYSPIHYMGHI